MSADCLCPARPTGVNPKPTILSAAMDDMAYDLRIHALTEELSFVEEIVDRSRLDLAVTHRDSAYSSPRDGLLIPALLYVQKPHGPSCGGTFRVRLQVKEPAQASWTALADKQVNNFCRYCVPDKAMHIAGTEKGGSLPTPRFTWDRKQG